MPESAASVKEEADASDYKHTYKKKISFTSFITPPDTLPGDSSKLKYPIQDKKPHDPSSEGGDNPFDLKDPQNKTNTVKYNPATGKYEIYRKVGSDLVKTGEMSREEYLKQSARDERDEYFKQRAKSQAGNVSGGGGNKPNLIKTPPVVDKIFRGGIIDIQPSGSAELTFGGNFNTVRNPQFSARQQKTGQFDFDQKIQLNVNGKIGNALNLGIKYDTDATFDFENQTKLDWVGKEDNMLRKVELGNVSMPLNGSLVQAGTSLFGIKTQWQFGRLGMTLLVSQNKGQRTETEVSGGAQVTEFNIQSDNYDENRHYFLSHFFKDQFDEALSNLPLVASGVLINRVEVWVTNKSGDFNNTRDILASMDLGEPKPHNATLNNGTPTPFTNNPANNLYERLTTGPFKDQLRGSASVMNTLSNPAAGFGALQSGLDYDLLTYGKQLFEGTDFTLNRQLGFISLNAKLNNDEILAVAYEYTYNGQGPYKVGEFTAEVSNNGNESNVLMLKMLKGTTIRTRIPMWELMMKNIYSLGSYNINPADLKLNVIYADDPSGSDMNYLPVKDLPGVAEGTPLLTLMNLDRINRQQERKPDGVFDAIENVTIQPAQGRIIFPVREPFGNHLRGIFGPGNTLADKYVYDALYDSTKFLAAQDVLHNKFFLRGSYKGSSSSEISLNALNVPQGTVIVTANGNRLTENVDYTVDYNAGKVTIINQGILQSGAVIRVSAESNSLFNIQQKTLLGGRFDYKVNKNLLLGGTILHMYERALTPKTNIGDEPLLNTVIGADISYNKASPFLTRLVDKLPFIETKEPSNFSFQGEYARIFPGKAKSFGKTRGVSYIDDFEGAETNFDLRLPSNWRLASLPQNQPSLFPEWDRGATNRTGWNDYRARISWYSADQTFLRDDNFTPANIKGNSNMRSDHYMRQILVKDVYPNKQLQQGSPTILPTLDIAYYPKEKGQYNFNTSPVDMNANGTFKNPEKSWGGIMRRIESNDFEAANIDYIEIWMMDPFLYDGPAKNNKGSLYIELGNVSEDILPDNRKAFENGFPKDGDTTKTDKSTFGRVPILPQINNAFDNEPSSRPFQDVGLDGLNDDAEREYDSAYLNTLRANFGATSKIYLDALADPSNDNYLHPRESYYDQQQANIVDRYKRYNSVQGNSTLDKFSDGTPKSATPTPDNEDINSDFTMNLTEDYFQYKIDLSKADLEVGKGFVTDISTIQPKLLNGKVEDERWIQIKVPIKQFTKAVGNISDFKSIRFMRMYLKGFSDSLICRFAQIQLVRADWRRYLNSLNTPGAVVPQDPTDNTVFVVSTVNVEENGQRAPIRYVPPPGIKREIDPTSPGAVQQNEQGLSLRVCNLKAGDSRAAYKTSNLDIRNYKYLKMFTHAEGENIKDGELKAFIRIGTDLVANYYEYEIPLVITPNGTTIDTKIWPSENEINFELEDLYRAKQVRSEQGNQLNRPFFLNLDGGRRVTLLGLPDLSNVRVIMLGVRNPTDVPKCGEVWFNELRVTDISNGGGWAANARMVAQMADFATVTASGNIKTIGFGGVDKKLNERSLTDNYQYDITSNIELGKFFPQKSGISIPMFIGWNENFIMPKYNPLNPDIELKTALSGKTKDEQNAIKAAALDYTSRYSLNFTNVRKARTSKGKPMPWDISNFNVTYSFLHLRRHNQQIEYNFQKTYHGSIGYSFMPTVKPLEPFKFVKGKAFALIRDFNLYPMPQSITVRFDVDRNYTETKNRNNDLFKQITPILVDKNFTMTRVYNVNYNITRNLKFDYSATVNARIQEPFGQLNTEAKKDSVREDFFNLGRMSAYTQTANFNYTVPLDKIPILNWITLTTRYGSNYGWQQAPPAFTTLGATIQNSRDLSVNGQLNMVSLYNKIPLLKRINTGQKPKARESKPSTAPASGTGSKPPAAAASKNKQSFGTGFLRMIMMVRNASFTYGVKNGIVLPGFMNTIDYLGQNFTHNVPGLPFILGSQDQDIRYRLAEKGSLTNDPLFYNNFTYSSTKTLSGTITVEPIKDFKINMTFDRSEQKMFSSRFKYNDTVGRWVDQAPLESGNFSSSAIFWRTAFEKLGSSYNSPAFDQFTANRYVVANRLQAADERIANKQYDPATGFPLGYGKTSQDVLIPAFIAGYTGRNSGNVSLSPFMGLPLPSWRINYNGLSKIKVLGNIFSNINLSHSYSGRYSVSSYTTNLQYVSGAVTPDSGVNLVPQRNIPLVSIREQFSPLIGVDLTLKNGWTIKVNVNRSRNINLMVTTASLTEQQSREFTFGAGYRTNDLKLPFKSRGRSIYLNNDLNVRIDVSIQNNITIVRKLDMAADVPAQGQRVIMIKPNADYKISDRINLNVFYDRRVSKPATSQSFPTALTNFGIKLRYTIQ